MWSFTYVPLYFVIFCWDTSYNRVDQCFILWFRKTNTDHHTLAQVKKFVLEQAMKVHRGGIVYRCGSTLSLTSARVEGGWSTPRPGRFTPIKETRYPFCRWLIVLQGRSGRDSSPRTVQPVASCCANGAILAHQLIYCKSINLHYYIASLFWTQFLLVAKWKLKRNMKHNKQCVCNVKLMRVLATIVVVGKR